MTVIKQEDLIQSIADSLQYISYYHPLDYIQALGRAYELEESPAAKDAIAQILTNSRMCAEGKRPICQDTGIVTVFVKVGMDVRWDGATMGVTDMINEGVRRGYLNPDNVLRASIVSPPALVPTAFGEKVTDTMQLPLAAIEFPHSFVAEKSPVAVIALTLIPLVLLFVIVSVAVVVPPTASVPQLSDSADRVMPPVSVVEGPTVRETFSEGDVGADL